MIREIVRKKIYKGYIKQTYYCCVSINNKPRDFILSFGKEQYFKSALEAAKAIRTHFYWIRHFELNKIKNDRNRGVHDRT